MLTLNIKERKGKKWDKDTIPGVLYGPKIKNISVQVNLKEFEKAYNGAGESSLISLEMDKKKFSVLIHAVELASISQKPIHVDFYQPNLDEEITADVPLVFEGEALAVKDLNGTLVKNIHEIEVKALPQNLPHEIKVNIEKLKTFEDAILIKDLVVAKEVKIERNPEDVVALVEPLAKTEEESRKPIEENVEEVEKVGEKKEEDEE